MTSLLQRVLSRTRIDPQLPTVPQKALRESVLANQQLRAWADLAALMLRKIGLCPFDTSDHLRAPQQLDQIILDAHRFHALCQKIRKSPDENPTIEESLNTITELETIDDLNHYIRRLDHIYP